MHDRGCCHTKCCAPRTTCEYAYAIWNMADHVLQHPDRWEKLGLSPHYIVRWQVNGSIAITRHIELLFVKKNLDAFLPETIITCTSPALENLWNRLKLAQDVTTCMYVHDSTVREKTFSVVPSTTFLEFWESIFRRQPRIVPEFSA